MNYEKKFKGGQAAGGAAVLLAIIAFFLIMFIILLPPQERAKILGENESEISTVGVDADLDDVVSKKNLLKTSPGRIDFLAQREIEHPLPVANIYTRTESKILAEKTVAFVKKGVFTEEFSTFPFSVPDLEHTEGLLLSFTIDDIEGRLIITLNGEEVYNAETAPGPMQPIALPRNFMQSQNLLVFAVSSPGVAFWKTHGLAISGIKVVADVTSVAVQSSKNVFLVSETEKQNMERAILKFQPSCQYGSVGKLSITINENEIYNALPDCAIAFVPIEFSASLVHQGENEVIFRTAKGTYVLSHIIIESKLRQVDFPTYYFDLSAEEFEDVQDGERRIRLRIDFVDVVVSKRGLIVFNGHATNFDTKEISFTLDLSEDAVPGTNAVKIKPKKTIEIRKLNVDLVK